MSPTNIFAPLSTPAESIYELSILVLAVVAAIFVLVAALLVYSVVKFRRRRNDDGREPAQVYGSLQVELAWTITPVIIVLVLFLASARVVFAVQTAPSDDVRVAEGRRVFEHTACINCHTVSGTPANGRFGPDLTHLMSRETLGAGIATNTPENLRAWIRRPDDFKPGSLMPPMGLSESQLDAVAAYLLTLQ